MPAYNRQAREQFRRPSVTGATLGGPSVYLHHRGGGGLGSRRASLDSGGSVPHNKPKLTRSATIGKHSTSPEPPSVKRRASLAPETWLNTHKMYEKLQNQPSSRSLNKVPEADSNSEPSEYNEQLSPCSDPATTSSTAENKDKNLNLSTWHSSNPSLPPPVPEIEEYTDFSDTAQHDLLSDPDGMAIR
jgi:hypothetical protein